MIWLDRVLSLRWRVIIVVVRVCLLDALIVFGKMICVLIVLLW